MTEHQSLPVYICRRAAAPVAVDGDLAKVCWKTVEPVWFVPTTLSERTGPALNSADAFFREGMLPAPGLDDNPPNFQRTAFAACWDDAHLYLAFRCEDGDVWGTYRRRDDPLYDEEVVEAFLSPTADVRHYYEFEVSPHNVVFDARVHSPDRHRRTMTVETAWDCPALRTAVRVQGALHDGRPPHRLSASRNRTDHGPPTTDDVITHHASRITTHDSRLSPGWAVEMAIPFAAFPEAGLPVPGTVWRANFYRIDRTTPPEFTAWSPTRETPANFHVPDCFGWLRFESRV